jgi:hypothetical protein
MEKWFSVRGAFNSGAAGFIIASTQMFEFAKGDSYMAKRIKRATTRGKQKRGKATKRITTTKRLIAKTRRAIRAKRTRAGKAKTTRSRSSTASKVARVAKKAASQAIIAAGVAGIGTALGELKKEQAAIGSEGSGEKDEQK